MLPSSAITMSGSGAFSSSSAFLAPLKNDLFDTKKVSIQSLNFVFVLRTHLFLRFTSCVKSDLLLKVTLVTFTTQLSLKSLTTTNLLIYEITPSYKAHI